jgi:hypothetical protein
MRRRLFALAFALGLTLTAALPAAAITGKSWERDFDHPFVGLIAFYDQDWVFIHRCTGELLSPTVVLTAGHCTNDPDQPNGAVAAHARVWFLQDVGTHYDPATQHDNVTGYPDSCVGTLGNGLGDWCAESSTMFNYGFDNFAGFPNIHDVGIVILDQAIDEPEYATLASANTVDVLARAKGTQDVTMRVSGYGLSYSLQTPVRGNGVGTVKTISLRERLQADEIITNLHNQATDSNQVVAVTSWGYSNAGCRGVGFYYRTDRQPVLDWIHRVVGDELWSEITVS